MTRAEFDKFCTALPATFNVIQWGDASVWKVGDDAAAKVFAIHSHWGPVDGIVLKPSEMAREIWRDAPGVGLAPYLGRAGWIKIDDGAITVDDLTSLIEGSYAINAAKLTRKHRATLGLQV
ncbi:MAG: MmcQ/YjbR family DNA-binding protein [Pseudomonadota bacterium]